MSNSLDQDQARHFVRPDLGSNCLQMLLADDTSRHSGVVFGKMNYYTWHSYVVGHVVLVYSLDWTNAGISFIFLTVNLFRNYPYRLSTSYSKSVLLMYSYRVSTLTFYQPKMCLSELSFLSITSS